MRQLMFYSGVISRAANSELTFKFSENVKKCPDNHQMIAAPGWRSNYMIKSNFEVELQGTRCFGNHGDLFIYLFWTGYRGLITEELNFLP